MRRTATFCFRSGARARVRRAFGRAILRKATYKSMPATGPDLARRFFLGAMFAAGLLADARQEVIDIFADMASSLTEGNAAGFLKPFDRKMQGYEQLDANVRALAEQNDVLTSAEVLENEGSEQARDVKLDWLLQIRSRAESGGLE